MKELKELSLSRTLAVSGDNDQDVRVATLNGRVFPGKSLSLTLQVVNDSVAAAHKEDLAAYLNTFMDELRQLARSEGLPV